MRCEDVKDVTDVMSLMSTMMPHCFGLVLSKMPAESRKFYLTNMIKSMLEAGSEGMSEKEKDDFVADVIAEITAAH